MYLGAGSVLQHIVANDGRTEPQLFRAAMTSSTFLPSQYHYNDPIREVGHGFLLQLSKLTSYVRSSRSAKLWSNQSRGFDLKERIFTNA